MTLTEQEPLLGSLTEQIFRLSAPYNNQFQGIATRLLFVCSVGLLRSPTAADQATLLGYNTRSCGSDSRYALIPLSVNLIAWADKIIFINQENYREAVVNFEDSEWLATMKHKAVIWNIEDDYERNDHWLIKVIQDKLNEL